MTDPEQDLAANAAFGTIRVLIAEDNPITREGLRSILTAAHITVVGEAASASEVLAQIAALSPDVVLLDLHMSNAEGLSALKTIRQAAPGVAVVVLSEDPGYLLAVLHDSTSYLSKKVTPEDLLAAVEAAAQGRSLVDQAALVKVIQALTRMNREGAGEEADPAAALTAREREVLRLVTRGLSNREIAETLRLSVGTVKVHVCNILTKLGMSDRVQAAVWAMQHGLGPDRSGDDAFSYPSARAGG